MYIKLGDIHMVLGGIIEQGSDRGFESRPSMWQAGIRLDPKCSFYIGVSLRDMQP